MSAKGNCFLDSLPPPCRDVVLKICARGELPVRMKLSTADQPPEFVYFLTSGVASLVVTMREGGSTEVGMIGRGGLTGGDALLGTESAPTDCFMQIAGQGYRAPIRLLQPIFNESVDFRVPVLRFFQKQMVLSAQFAGCNRLHEAEGRLARWLLMTSDLAELDDLHLTQEFLAEMLGTQRTTVAVIAGLLQRAGLISYRRGNLRILDRAGLEDCACSCYQVFKRVQGNSAG